MYTRQLFIKSATSGPRLRYVAKELFTRRLGIVVVFLHGSQPVPAGGLCIGHGHQDAPIHIPDCGILDGNPFTIDFGALHSVESKKTAQGHVWNGDILGIAFWFLSRFEEYENSASDPHGRFPPEASMAAQHGFLEIAWIDIWVAKLCLQLKAFGMECRMPPYLKEITIDIDNPTAYHHKSWKRNAGGLLQSFLGFRFGKMRERIQVLANTRKDPYNTFETIFRWCEELHIKPLFFFWVGNYGKFDKGLPWHIPFFQSLIKEVVSRFAIGLHPSYASFLNQAQLDIEKRRLEKISGRAIKDSRQHFLRMQLPQTYRQLLAAGIAHDYSMGYGDAFGFRASTSLPFAWYDLENETETSLIIHPFCLMDSTAYYKLGLAWPAFEEKINEMEEMLRPLGGCCSIVLHNDLYFRHLDQARLRSTGTDSTNQNQ